MSAEKVLILDNIRSVHNTGSIFRTADTVGIDEIICVGTTPTPLDRFGNKRRDFAKVALGAEDSVAWKFIEQKNCVGFIKTLKVEGFTLVTLEQSKSSVDYKELGKKIGKQKVAIIVGNEVGGVSKKLLKLSDYIAEIPMMGKKESLNVAVATGIFLFRLLDK